ncbi:uncharacterized protein FPRO_16035 [Fusarium proliferatum ET1]|uniref:Terpene synthase n=1 Tax=Fusarium proliferatum (strain ET1) TaxID=1227346 RepID=A0A1L7WB22_FUSPR|nr:uncharacterized protein FPRO_16035 [Fusarium proliferatum ET1]CZR49827.1 uncharacterized protein FPRO_16035 [Fusarium proliferatum ET1]
MQFNFDQEHETLAHRIRGQEAEIPPVVAMFSEYPIETNKHYSLLVKEIDTWIASAIRDTALSDKYIKADFGKLIACQFPYAKWEKLRVIGAFITWGYLWDDQMDMGRGKTSGEKSSKVFVLDSLRFIQQSLDVSKQYISDGAITTPPTPLMAIFEVYGQGLRMSLTQEDRDCTYVYLNRWIMAVYEEDCQRSLAHMPTPEEYLKIRVRAFGFRLYVIFFEYCLTFRLKIVLIDSCPRYMNQITFSKAFKATTEGMQIQEECGLILIYINDLFSCKKEVLRGDFHENIIPLIVHSSPSFQLQDGIDTVLTRLGDSLKKIELMVGYYNSSTANKEIRDDVLLYIKEWRTVATGWLTWSMGSSRFGLLEGTLPDSSVIFTI